MDNPDAPRTIGINARGWSPAEQVTREPDFYDSLFLPENVNTRLFPYGWREEYYVVKQLRVDGHYSWVMAQHADFRNKNKNPISYFISIKNEQDSVSTHFQMTRHQAEQLFTLKPEEILDAFHHTKKPNLLKKMGVLFSQPTATN